MLPSALLTASAYAISTDFGAESSRPASLLCTLRTHQSPGEWQHSLLACSLALARRDFHPLDFFKWFPLRHFWFLHLHAFPSAIGACRNEVRTEVQGIGFIGRHGAFVGVAACAAIFGL